MEVHTRKRPIQGWREFVGEIGVIVMGVLIALAGEQTVEALHWRARVHETEANMRTELLKDNGAQVYHRLAQSRCIVAQLDGLERALIDERDRGVPFRATPVTKPYFFTYDDAAWQSAQTTGVTSHMSGEQMNGWASGYLVVPALNSFAAREEVDYAELASAAAAPAHPSDDLRNRLMAAIYRARADNTALRHNGAVFLRYLRQNGLKMSDADKKSALAARRLTFTECSTVVEPPAQE